MRIYVVGKYAAGERSCFFLSISRGAMLLASPPPSIVSRLLLSVCFESIFFV